jgi:hypothetical protein
MSKNARAKLCKNDEAAVSGLTLFPPYYIVFKMPLPGHSVGVLRHAHPPQIFFFQKKIFQKNFYKKYLRSGVETGGRVSSREIFFLQTFPVRHVSQTI